MNVKNHTLWTVMPFIVGIVSFALLAVFNEVRGFDLWRNYALSGILLGSPTIYVLWRFQVHLPHYIQWTIVGALLTHYGGGSLGSPDPYKMGLLGMHGVNGAYHHFEWWDHLTHGVGIGASAMGIAYLFEVFHVRRGLQWSSSAVFLCTMLASLTAGVGVELYEYLGKTAFQTIDQGGYENTMRDLHFNFMGAMVGGGLAVTVNRSRFWNLVKNRWGEVELVSRNAPWWQRTTSPMVGFLTFCSLPAGGALFLATKFFTEELPPNDLHMYDPALQTLTWLTGIGILLAPVTARIHSFVLKTHLASAAPTSPAGATDAEPIPVSSED